jgi:aspartyl/asparaginyl-tRNA synthetase
MDEKHLLIISFIGSLIGLFALFLLSDTLDYNEQTIEKINSAKTEDMVKVTGQVSSIRNSGNITFISIKQPDYMDIIVFDANLSLVPGEEIEVIGKGQEYNSKMEIIGERIRVIG